MTSELHDEIATLVVCEDDDVTLDLLCEHLSADRFSVLPAATAADALRLCRCNPDLLVLDLTLPDTSGLQVLREIRDSDSANSGIDARLPVIALGACRSGRDQVRVLESGADDYLVKPFPYPELRARIRAVLRRRSNRHGDPLRVGELILDFARRRVTVEGRVVLLSARELGLLRVLASEPTRVFSKEELLVAVWGPRSETRRRTLDAHASRLRQKLDPDHKRFVINCWGIGYRLVDG